MIGLPTVGADADVYSGLPLLSEAALNAVPL